MGGWASTGTGTWRSGADICLLADTFLPIITASLLLASHSTFTGPGAEPVSRILAVEFYCLTSAKYDSLTSPGSNLDSYPSQNDDFDLVNAATSGSNPLDVLEHPCAGIRKILSSPLGQRAVWQRSPLNELRPFIDGHFHALRTPLQNHSQCVQKSKYSPSAHLQH